MVSNSPIYGARKKQLNGLINFVQHRDKITKQKISKLNNEATMNLNKCQKLTQNTQKKIRRIIVFEKLAASSVLSFSISFSYSCQKYRCVHSTINIVGPCGAGSRHNLLRPQRSTRISPHSFREHTVFENPR